MLHIVRPTLMYPFFGTIRSEVNCYRIFHLHGTQLVQLVTIVTGWHWFILLKLAFYATIIDLRITAMHWNHHHWKIRTEDWEKRHTRLVGGPLDFTPCRNCLSNTIKLPQSEDGVENRTRLAPGQYRNEWNIKLSASVGGRTTRRDATAGKSNNPPRETPFARFRNVCKFPARERATLLNWEQSRQSADC